MSCIRISAMDTWFFRESRPMDALGGSELASVFPPPPRTVLGALRSAIGDAQGVDWREFHEKREQHPLYAHIGFGKDLGPIALQGLWLNYTDRQLNPAVEERLYPLPQLLLQNAEKNPLCFTRLCIGTGVQTHLGRVRLPQPPPGKLGFKPFGQAWVTTAGLNAILAGGEPEPAQVIAPDKLFTREPRLGIARDNQWRTAQEGLLYQTCHLRPDSGVSLEMDLSHAAATLLPTGLVRFGGEGRLGHLMPGETKPGPTAPTPTQHTRGLILILLSPARFESGEKAHWLPDGFQEPANEKPEPLYWSGEIAGVDLRIHAAVLGKSLREGGWDLATGKPGAVQSLVPAGSAYYASLPDGSSPDRLLDAIEKLHGSRIGKEQELGRGLIACGLWNDKEY